MPEKIIMRVIMIGVFLLALWLAYSGYRKDMDELHSLRDYKTSVEDRTAVSDAGHDSFQAQKNSAANQIAGNAQQRSFIEAKTAEVANEDKATADFLAMPIPQRLRDADREARLNRGLGADQRAPGSAVSTN